MSESGEPNTPAEIAQEKVERTVRDAWLCMKEIAGMEADPIARQFLKSQEADLWSIKTTADLVLSHMNEPKLRAVS